MRAQLQCVQCVQCVRATLSFEQNNWAGGSGGIRRWSAAAIVVPRNAGELDSALAG